MKIYVGLISSSPELIDEFTKSGQSLVPKEIRQRLHEKCEFKFDGFNPNASKGGFTVEQHLLESSKGYDLIIGLAQTDMEAQCVNIRHAMLIALFAPDQTPNGNLKNFFSSRLTKLFKAALFTLDKMAAADIEQAMRLPIRNFQAPELVELCRVYREEILQITFHNNAKQLISRVRERKQPRRGSSFMHQYFIDDNRLHFIFGKETHEVLPTGSPHQPHCELTGNYRFGRKISTNKHFNVSQGDGDQTYITGTFRNCHDSPITPSNGRTHLNMFSNDHC